MVNVRKIGAIATGALFIGATFGMASAVTVPSGFQSSLLADNGVAKAQLVVGGSGADGKVADTESAKVIQDAVKARLAGTVGGDINIEFGSNELHDDSPAGDDYTQSTFTAAGYTDANVEALNSSAVLRFDGNSDGDLKDSDDYDLYNHIVMVDRSNGDIQFAENWTEHSTYSNGDGDINAGDVITIKGDKYVVTDNDTSDGDVELGPAIAKKLTSTTVDKDNAVTISGTKKVLYGNDGGLWFYDEGSLADGPVSLSGIAGYPYKLTSDDIESDAFTPYNIYVVSNTSSQAVVTFVEKSQLVTLSNDEEGVMGYSSVKVGDSDWFTGGETGVFFLSDPISLVKGETIDLPDTYYQLKFTSSKQFDILRKKVSSISSGSKLKSTKEPGKDFLKSSTTITVSTTGGTSATDGPALDIVDLSEDTANTAMNLVLIGGPAANTMTAELVENDKSKIDWYTSDGDIEVIKSAFKSGKYAVIVAGKNRFGTKDAAEAVAGEL